VVVSVVECFIRLIIEFRWKILRGPHPASIPYNLGSKRNEVFGCQQILRMARAYRFRMAPEANVLPENWLEQFVQKVVESCHLETKFDRRFVQLSTQFDLFVCSFVCVFFPQRT
jgi:hypothetical protein